jgi:hypothetical protein
MPYHLLSSRENMAASGCWSTFANDFNYNEVLMAGLALSSKNKR